MRILHLTDYHFSNDSSKGRQKQKTISEAVAKILANKKVDFIFSLEI
jgi:DNA repair exonuclease SbcCD nuclease subunit